MDANKVDILILGVGKTKDNKKSVLDFAFVDLKVSSNRKGYNVSQAWFEGIDIFDKVKEKDIGRVVKADISFEIGQNGHPRMKIANVYN